MLVALLLVGLLTPPDTLQTRAEASAYHATSSYADVLDFLDALGERSPDLHRTTFGTTAEGRALPLVVWGAPAATPEAVRATGRLRVFVLANIHAGEVAGKEAALELLRELASGQHVAWADSLVLLVAPLYNADGNERVDPHNRPLQHGPVEGMGQRPNAQGLDLNRDFVKLDAPETRGLVRALDAYDPHVFLDLHTTNGTTHGYHLTYAPPLHPNTHPALDTLLRARWLPDVSRAVEAATGWATTDYGNDKPEWGQPEGWATFDPRPRFSTNYVGLRGRVGILSEAYSYAPFEERIAATRHFVTAVLDWAHAHAAEVRTAVAEAGGSVVGQPLMLRSAGTWARHPDPAPVLMGEVVEEPNPLTGEPMWRRLDVRRPVAMPRYDRFSGREPLVAPAAYLVPPGLTDVLDRLDAHGVRSWTLEEPTAVTAEAFRVDSVRVAERAFQGRRAVEPFGRYAPVTTTAPLGSRVVPVVQPLGRLVFSLLEARSDGGLAAWGLVPVEAGDTFPILRIVDGEDVDRLRPAPR